jgi:hypothetical protein
MLRLARRALAPAVLALSLALPAAASAEPVTGTVEGGVRLPDAESCAGVICTTGTLDPFGAASFVYAPTTFTQIDRSCFAATAELIVTFASTGDTLVLGTDSTACFRGNSPNTVGATHSWGNPVTDSGEWVVLSGTGEFEGATGAGTYTLEAAGSALRGSLSGDITLG